MSILKLNMNNPQSVEMFNHTCTRGWFHHKRRVRKKNYARAHRVLEIWIGVKNRKINLIRAKKLTGWRESEWYLVKGY